MTLSDEFGSTSTAVVKPTAFCNPVNKNNEGIKDATVHLVCYKLRARALASRPRLLLLDEPSLGLAPLIVEEFFRVVQGLNQNEGLTVLVVEQNANIALEVSRRAYLLEVGRVALEGESDELLRHEGVRASYLGY